MAMAPDQERAPMARRKRNAQTGEGTRYGRRPRRNGQEIRQKPAASRSNSADHLPPRHRGTQRYWRRVDGICLVLFHPSSFIPWIRWLRFFHFSQCVWNMLETWRNAFGNGLGNNRAAFDRHEMKAKAQSRQGDPASASSRFFAFPICFPFRAHFPPPPIICRCCAKKLRIRAKTAFRENPEKVPGE